MFKILTVCWLMLDGATLNNSYYQTIFASKYASKYANKYANKYASKYASKLRK